MMRRRSVDTLNLDEVRTRFLREGPGGPEPDSQIRHGSERGLACVVSFRQACMKSAGHDC